MGFLLFPGSSLPSSFPVPLVKMRLWFHHPAHGSKNISVRGFGFPSRPLYEPLLSFFRSVHAIPSLSSVIGTGVHKLFLCITRLYAFFLFLSRQCLLCFCLLSQTIYRAFLPLCVSISVSMSHLSMHPDWHTHLS